MALDNKYKNELLDKIDKYIVDDNDALATLYDKIERAKTNDEMYSLLDENKGLLRSRIEGYADIERTKPDIEKTVSELYEEYPNTEVEPAYLRSKAKKLGIETEELGTELQHKQQQEQLRSNVEKEASDREMRRQMLKNLPWYASVMMSESERDRFVNDPEHSAYYQSLMKEYEDDMKKSMGYFDMSDEDKKKFEAKYPGLFEAHPRSNTLSDRVDIGLGFAGGAADLVPGLGGVVVGPALRGLRTAKNDGIGLDLVGSIGKDVAFNAGVNYGPTAILSTIGKRSKNAAKDVAGGWAEAIWEGGVKETAKEMSKDLKELTGMTRNALTKQSKIAGEMPETLKELRQEGVRTQKEANVERKFSDDIRGNAFESDVKTLAEKKGISDLEAAKEYTDKMNKGEFDKAYDLYEENGKKYILEQPAMRQTVKENLGPMASKYADVSAMKDAASKLGKIVGNVRVGFKQLGNPLVKATKNIVSDKETIPESSYKKEEQLSRLGLGKTKTKPQYTEQELEDYLQSGPIPNIRMFSQGFVPGEMAKIGDNLYVKKPEWETSLPVQAYRYWEKKYGGQ